MTTTPVTRGLVDIHTGLNSSTRMDLALKVLDVGNLPVAGLSRYWITSVRTDWFENTFLSEGGGPEMFLSEELFEQYPAAEYCISRAVRHSITPKTASAKAELFELRTLLSGTEVTHTQCAIGLLGFLSIPRNDFRASSA